MALEPTDQEFSVQVQGEPRRFGAVRAVVAVSGEALPDGRASDSPCDRLTHSRP